MWALWIFIGMMIGGTLGVVTMCIFQINKTRDDEIKKNKKE